MKLYGYFRSSAAYRVRIALALKGLPYEYAAIHLRKGEQRAVQYRSLNAQELLRYLHEMIVKSGFAGTFRIGTLTIQDCQPLAIVVGQVIINLGKHGFGSVSEFFQAAECCFKNGAPGFLLLAIGHWRARQAQLPDQRW